MKVGIGVSLILWAAFVMVAVFASGCGSLPLPKLMAGQRFIVELDQASGIAANDDEPHAVEARERRLRGS